MTKRQPLTIFKSVILALFLREVQTRFGSKKMGYFWAIWDAMSMVLVFVIVRGLIRGRDMPGVDYSVFLAIAFLAFFMWRNIVNQSMDCFESNKALYSYVQVKPFDTLVARFMVQVIVTVLATVVFIGIGFYFKIDMTIQDYNMVFLSVVWLSVFGFGLGVFSAVVGLFYETFKTVMSFLMMPLMFMSAIFYSVDFIPAEYRYIVLYNPVTHFMEMLHGYYFQALDTRYVNYEYMFYWTFIPLFLGLILYRYSEKKIISS